MAPPPVAPTNPLANPNVPLTGAALVAAAHALASAQTQGPLQELATQIAQNNSQNMGALNQVGGYFNQLGGLAGQGAQQEQDIASRLNAQLAQIGQDQQGQLGQIGQNATQSLLKYSPQASANTTNPGLQGLASEMARQQGLAAQDHGAFRAFGATQGANYSGLGAANLGVLGLRGQEDLTNIAQAGQVRNEPLMAKIAALQATKGADFTTALGRLRQQEITNKIAETGLGIKQQDIQAANARTAATIQGENQRNQATIQGANQRSSAQNNPSLVGSPAWARVQSLKGTQWSDNPSAVGSPAWARVQKTSAAASGGTTKPLTTQANNTFWQKTGTIEQLIKDAQAKGVSEAQIRGWLADGNNPSKTRYDPFQVQVAYELLGYNGQLNGSTAATLHNQYGVRGGTYNGQPIKVRSPVAAAVQNVGNQTTGALSGLF